MKAFEEISMSTSATEILVIAHEFKRYFSTCGIPERTTRRRVRDAMDTFLLAYAKHSMPAIIGSEALASRDVLEQLAANQIRAYKYQALNKFKMMATGVFMDLPGDRITVHKLCDDVMQKAQEMSREIVEAIIQETKHQLVCEGILQPFGEKYIEEK